MLSMFYVDEISSNKSQCSAMLIKNYKTLYKKVRFMESLEGNIVYL